MLLEICKQAGVDPMDVVHAFLRLAGEPVERFEPQQGVTVWGISGTVDRRLLEFETVVRLRDGNVFVFNAWKYWHGCVKRNHNLSRYAITSEWNRDTHWTAMEKERAQKEAHCQLEKQAEERAAA